MIYVALLRGINVGGKNKLPMQELVAMFDEVGCQTVRTYIQSGNVVFQATESHAPRISALIERAIFNRRDFRIPIVMRTADELRAIASGNPFLRVAAGEAALHVVFLANLPSSSRAGTLDPNRSPPDKFALRGREIYLHCPNGVARTKFTNNYFDTRLATTSTIRNWRTVLKLIEMTQQDDDENDGKI